MNAFFTPKLMAIILLLAPQQGVVPTEAVGKWKIGQEYYIGQSIGLTTDQKDQIKRLTLTITPNQIDVCKKHLTIDTVEIHQLSASDFQQKFSINPILIELTGDSITEISINPMSTMNACLDFEDPGTHFFVANKRVVIEVNHNYFPLIPDK